MRSEGGGEKGEQDIGVAEHDMRQRRDRTGVTDTTLSPKLLLPVATLHHSHPCPEARAIIGRGGDLGGEGERKREDAVHAFALAQRPKRRVSLRGG